MVKNWHGEAAAGQTHARDSLQPGSAVPGPNKGTLLPADLRYEPVLRLEDAATSSVKPKLTPMAYVVNDASAGDFYEGWETQLLQWYPNVGWLSGGFDATLSDDFGVPGVGNPMRHFSPDGQTFATLNNTDAVIGPAFLLSGTDALGPTTIAALGPAAPNKTILLGSMEAFRSLKPLKLAEGANNRLNLASPLAGFPPATGNQTKVAVWNNGFKYLVGGAPVLNAPDKPAPLFNPQYYVLETGNQTNGDHGWWTIGGGNSNLQVDQPIYAPIYVASLTPELSLGFLTSIGIGTDENARTPLRGYKPGCNQGWFACPHFGMAPAPVTTAGEAQMQFVAGTVNPLNQLRPNRGNILVAVGGVYNSAAPVWPTEPNSPGNPDETESIFVLPAPTTTGWTMAVTIFRPQLSRDMRDAEAEGVLFRGVKDPTHQVIVKWKPQTLQIEITSINGTATSVINLPFGHWFRTQPMTVIIADNGVKLEASALSPRLGVKTGVAANGTIGPSNWPSNIAMSEPNKVFGLELGGIAYKREFLDANMRKASLQDLEFLVH